MPIQIRPATPADGAAVAEIYAYYVAETAITFDETAPTAAEMSQRIADTLARYPFLVATDDQQAVIGYAYASPHRPRASYRWSVDTAIYLDPSHRRLGVGSALYARLIPIITAQGYKRAYAGITLPNAASVGLHERLGFKPIGVYSAVGYKLGQWRDVGWWELSLTNELPVRPSEPQPWVWKPE